MKFLPPGRLGPPLVPQGTILTEHEARIARDVMTWGLIVDLRYTTSPYSEDLRLTIHRKLLAVVDEATR